MKKPANIYLFANKDRTWEAFASDDPPKEDAAFFVREGSYPAELYYVRFDVNGSSVMEKELCQNIKELLETLNWIGKTGGIVSGVWEFDEDKEISPALYEIFKDGMERKPGMVFRIVIDERISSAKRKQ